MLPNIRVRSEEMEVVSLGPAAMLARNSRGREYPDAECDIRTCFQRDRDRIVHCKAFRRLKHKTQVFISPEGDHYRTRLTHTLEVAQIARTAARALRLNEDLTEAIALGHDLGHTPFGHSGEAALNVVLPGGFRHNEQSLRVVELLERRSERYPGLNLSWEVRDGILHHTGGGSAATLEGQLVHVADRIAYLNHDIDDSIRAGVLAEESLPRQVMAVLGASGPSRIDMMVHDLVTTSWEQPEIKMSEPIWAAMAELREFLFTKVYVGSEAKRDEGKAQALLQELYRYYVAHPEALAAEWGQEPSESSSERAAADFIAGMTDPYAMAAYAKHFLPAAWTR